MDAPSIDLALRQALSNGDRRAAMTLLVRHHADDVFALCRAMMRDRALAEDLAQDTFGRALTGLAGYRFEAAPRTWLLTIARHACLDALRRARRAPFEDEPEPDAHADDARGVLERLVDRGDLERALAPLGEIERALVVLHHGHGVGYDELAGAFALREGAVRMRMSRALARMRAAIEAADEVDGELSFGCLEEAKPAKASRPAPAPASPARARSMPATPSRAVAPPRRRGLGAVFDVFFGASDEAPPVREERAAHERAEEGHASTPSSPLREPAPLSLRARLEALVARA